MKIQTLLETLAEIPDPRRQWGNKKYKLTDVLFISFCTIVCGGEDFEDMQTFAIERYDWLSQYLELPEEVPCSDTFRRILERIDPKKLSDYLYDWLGVCAKKGEVVSIDGKTIRGSKNSHHKAYHVVSAFVRENSLTLGELKIEEKSNEIKAVPELIDMLDLKGTTVTADAMSCQKEIATKITKKKANYVLAVKENQKNLHDDIRDYFQMSEPDFTSTKTSEQGHGRIETREYFLSTDIAWMAQKNEWSNLKAIGSVRTKVIKKEETTIFVRYFITSLEDIDSFSNAVREHWGIENQLHWCLDVAFGEDACKAKKDNSPLNLNVLRKIALPLLKQIDLGRIGLKKKMFQAALNTGVLERIIIGEK